ncbi:MAG: DUF1993 domain-containing protein [Leptolyngbyaceae cyanobacterium MO_188.B28]|nr:DUF1993 domain-containing protein [Leptolyngbyaceae cyanobacterium MO_188.B28]
MTISMYQASIPPLKRTLNNLIGILKKGEAHAEAKKIDPTVLINSRLYPDMFALARQVQIASDVSRRGVSRLAGVDAPTMEDAETTFAELIDRLEKAISYLETFTPDQIDGSEEKEVTVPIGGGETMVMKGWPFLSMFVLPNVYFHVTTAYDILRNNGVEVGKRDFLGQPK